MVFHHESGESVKRNVGSTLQYADISGTIAAKDITDDWNIVLRYTGTFNHVSSVPVEKFNDLKSLANAYRTNQLLEKEAPNQRYNDTVAAPGIGQNFRGNSRENSVPMDNSMAVSRNGFIVSGINTNIIFTGPDGKITYTKSLADFFILLGLGTRMYDPRVIYDVEANRFIFMCLHGSEPTNTYLCVAFSKTEDPNGEWNYYKIAGNPSGDNHWFDYPNIGLSKDDIYIAGLMRDTKGDWQYSVLYQINKHNGYAGQSLQWKYYNELKDTDGNKSFNLVPAQSGWNYLTSPGMYFVSNNPLGGNTYNLYYTTDNLSGNPSLISLQTTGPATLLSPDGRQPSTPNVLNTFDSRVWSAMFLDDIVHIGSHVNTPRGDAGLFYGRLNVRTLDVHADILTIAGKDLAFPSFSAFGYTENDPEILVNYLISGPDLFPGQQLSVCAGIGPKFSWSQPVMLKNGLSIIDALLDNRERWGDYTTSCRRFINGRPESWVTGCFGESRSYGTWLGQLVRAEYSTSHPMAEFIADKTTTSSGTEISFSDLTTKNPFKWNWTFEKGSPNVSNEQNPKVVWAENGAYTVRLIVTNDLGTDTITKYDYIHIKDPVVKPIADFLSDRDTIYKYESILFKNLSSDNAINYKWTFTNGTPSSSTDKNPEIRYNKTGSHLVSLTVSNTAGTGTKTKQRAITVLENKIPVTSFSSDKSSIPIGDSIRYFDNSTGGVSNRLWIFEGGTPEITSERNPVVTYNNQGKFNVMLVVANDAGKDSIIKLQYAIVGNSGLSNIGSDKSIFKIFPNPSYTEIINLEIETDISSKYKIDLIDIHGHLTKNLYFDKIKAGHSLLTFSTQSLKAGTYFVKISSTSENVRIIPVIVIR